MEQLHNFKSAVSGVLGAISAMLGWFGWMIIIYAAAMTLDWFTGTAVARKNGEWSSAVARNGCWNKLGSITAVLVSLMLDGMVSMLISEVPGITLPFEYSVLLGPVVLVWYIVAELGSIVENSGKLGAPIPKFLITAIKALHVSAEHVASSSTIERK